jgi:predicted nucleic acid-binding Zn ribbon protein
MNVSMFHGVCRVCAKSEEQGATFSPSKCDWICNACRHAQRRADPVIHLANKLKTSLRQRGLQHAFPGMPFVSQVLERYRGQSAISGEDDVSRLCIVCIDPSKPWHLDNAILVTSSESYAISRTRTLEQRLRIIQLAAA